MLSSEKLKKLSGQRKISVEQLAGQLVRAGLDKQDRDIGGEELEARFIQADTRQRRR